MNCLFRLTVPKGFNNIFSTIHSNQSWSKFTHALPASNGFSMPPEPASKGHLCGWNPITPKVTGRNLQITAIFRPYDTWIHMGCLKIRDCKAILEMIGLWWFMLVMSFSVLVHKQISTGAIDPALGFTMKYPARKISMLRMFVFDLSQYSKFKWNVYDP